MRRTRLSNALGSGALAFTALALAVLAVAEWRTARAQPVPVRNAIRFASRLAEPGELLRGTASGAAGPATRPLRALPIPGRPAPGAPPPAPAPTEAPAPDVPPPRVAVLATKPGDTHTDLIFQGLDSAAVAAPVASVEHLPDTEVRGAVVPQTNAVLVIAGTTPRKDPAFGASLLLMREQQDTRLVVDRVYHGTRPLVLDDGRAFVQRGQEGPEPSEADLAAGRLRVDTLTIEQIDLAGDTPKVMSTFQGYIAFIAGSLGHEIFVYRVGPDGADITGIDADSGRERTIQRPLPPFARDFSIDAQAQNLLFTNVDPANPGQWAAVSVSVAPPAPATPVVPPQSRTPVTARAEVLERAFHPALIPTAWIGRGVAINRNRSGLEVTRTANAAKVPFTRGADVVREFFFARNETWALASHHEEGKLPQPMVIRTSTMDVQKVAAPTQSRVDLAGMLDQGSPAKPAIRRLPAVTPRGPVRFNPKLLREYVPHLGTP